MLNRRILRLKAMQALYALEQAQRSNYQLSLDYIHQKFEPNLNSMVIPTAEEVAQKRKLGKELFEANYQNETLEAKSEQAEVDVAVSEAIRIYNTQIQKERRLQKQEMIKKTEGIHDDYLKLLKLLMSLADHSEADYNSRKARQYSKEVIFDSELHFTNNALIQHLVGHKELQDLLIGSNWATSTIKDWFKILREEEFYKKYLTLKTPTFSEDKEFMITLTRDFIMQNDVLDDFFDENDIYWSENRSVLRNMLLKTVKNIEEENIDNELGTKPVELYLLSRNWEDDKEFFEELFQNTVNESLQNEKLIAERLKNWDINRVALTDTLILKMAISEMMHCPSIPVKVSINEYVELAKNYSTPKSKEFVNGILDTVSEYLVNEGQIKKSGRGLLDNQ
ncbi:NusB antitermination factor [Bernardetia litoralis DSM 6794]|uniref:Transcription antitermination protein NusB n=1 Tax=Bernardetia litoralis (strain ATCC 23117 / DSM 6794 / NBRC 15988 / NCIMB 1366 / Fx l1 / Sio-4) TaxID=880071 RepID=I4AJ48_BERLS|nr:transcription antitermination factor NusB [Bernardetia litoralis]AFM03983.1 NusB antitermination factor [Bernardetia litoralis DSM 6794]